MASFNLSDNAKCDLENIYRYGIANWGADAAEQYINNLFEHLENIAGQPLMYPAVNHIRNGYRRSTFTPNSIYYTVTAGGIKVTAILGQQDISQLEL